MAYLCAENGNLMAIAQQLVQQQQQQHHQQQQQQNQQQQIYASANLSGYFGREAGSVGNMSTPWLPNPVWHEAGVGFPAGFCSEVLGDLCSTTTTSYLSEPNSVLDLSRASMALSPMEQFHEFGHRLQDGISSKQLMCLAGGIEPPPPDFKELYHDCLVKKERPAKEGSADSGLKLGNCGAGDGGFRPCSVFRLPELQTFVFDSPVATTRNEFAGPDVCTEWMDCFMTDLQPEAGHPNNNNSHHHNNNSIASCFDSNPCESTESSELPGAGNGGGGGGYPCSSEDAWQNEFGVLGEAFKRSPPGSWTPDNTATELLCSSPSADMLSAASSELLSSSSLKGKAALQEQYSGGGHEFKPLHSMATVQNACSVQLKKEPTGVSGASQKWQPPPECLNVKREEDCKAEAEALEHHVQGQSSQLMHSLLDCAKIIDAEPERAGKSIAHLRTISSPRGDPAERVVSYFADALAKRLSSGIEQQQQQQQQQVESPDEKCFEESTLAYKALNDACPYSKFAHLTANQAILEAMEKAEKIHIIDFGIVQGVQWAALLQAFATRAGGKPQKVKITGIPAPSLGLNPAASLLATGKRLSEFAALLDLEFEFCPVSIQMDKVEASMLKIEQDECVAVNFMLQLYHLLGESSEPLSTTLKLAHALSPRVVTLGEYEANLNACRFQVRFRNALQYYSAIFESMEPSMARDCEERLNVEKLFFAEKITGIVAYEGAERKMRLEGRDQWRSLMESAGFKSSNLSHYAISQARILLWNYNDRYTLDDHSRGFLSLAWQERPLLTVSAWRC